MSIINFQCKKCRQVFDCNVGDVTFPPEDLSPKFQKDAQCSNCGRLSMGKFELTELGQSQLTDLFLNE